MGGQPQAIDIHEVSRKDVDDKEKKNDDEVLVWDQIEEPKQDSAQHNAAADLPTYVRLADGVDADGVAEPIELHVQ